MAPMLYSHNSQVQICMTIKLLQIVRHPAVRGKLFLSERQASTFARLEVPTAFIPVEHFLRGLGVLVQRNFPVSLCSRSEAACIATAMLRPCGSAKADSENVAQHGLPQRSTVSARTSVAWLDPLLWHQGFEQGRIKRHGGRVTEQV